MSCRALIPTRKIRHIVAIMSGKGGVGKSLVTGLLGGGAAPAWA